MLTYDQSLEFIHGIARFGSKPGLRRVTMLLERMGRPQDKLKFIHVAGSDGKGSTCTMLSHIYTKAGYKTGLYISPFVLDFRERIQVNNEMIAPNDLARSTTKVKELWDELNNMGETPTEFEVVVAIAMDYFVEQGCDLVILEVGMGGRFDATNVIGTPLCSVITHISMDHMEYLGDSIEKIALEKSGIIKPGGRTVVYPQQQPLALAVIMEHCARENNPLHMPHQAEILRSDITGSRIRYDGQELTVPLPGEHQVWNAVTAVETVKAVRTQGFIVSAEQIAEGIGATRFPSRVEVLCQSPLILLDGGHNPAEAAALAGVLDMLKGRPIHAVMGMLADKDVDAVLSQILPRCASLIAVAPNYPRALPARELAEKATPYCSNISWLDDKRTALARVFARCLSEPNSVLLACGSLYLSSELRPILLKLAESGINLQK